jgi:hypothetical protein
VIVELKAVDQRVALVLEDDQARLRAANGGCGRTVVRPLA